MTNVDALKSLYVALGGDSGDVADVTLVCDAIAKIATLAGTIGVELPKVTTENNGQVLTVVGGEWKAANLPD